MSTPKRIAVIGAGASGLVAIKSLKEQGLEPLCFEKTNVIGGLWKYHDEDVDGVPSVPWYTFMDHSKEMWAFSDFPPKKELPNFASHTEIYEYLKEFASHFGLLKHIQFSTEVVEVAKSQTYADTGQWIVSVKDSKEEEKSSNVPSKHVFDGVLICSGHLSDPYIPNFPGIQQFQGKIIHTHSLKKVDEFTDKKVVIIGSGSAGLDAAVEIARVAKQVYLFSRNGSWVIPRLGPEGLPMDIALIRNWYNNLCKIYTQNAISDYFDKNFLRSRFDHELYQLKPNRFLLNGKPVINDSIALELCSGRVILKKSVKCFINSGIVFSGEREDTVVETDVVVFATGYRWKFSFLEKGILNVNSNHFDLYKNIYPPHLKHPTLAFIGLIKPIGPIFPVFEIQCRWVSCLLSQKSKLPSQRSMMLDIAVKQQRNIERFPNNPNVSLITDYITYMQEIAAKIGAKPNMLKLLFTDPKLFYFCYFGPFLSYQYRLCGPNSWTHARDTMLSAYYRIKYPLQGEGKQQIRSSSYSKLKIFLSLNAIIAFLIFAAIRMLKQNKKLKYYLFLKLFPYVNMIQQLYYNMGNKSFV